MATAHLTADIAREYLNYDPDSGCLTWRFDHWGHKAGEVAGCLHKKTGYRRVGLLGSKHQAHRLAWLIHYGEWPAVIDHANGDKADNRLENLRSGDVRFNNQNRRAPAIGSTSALLGAQRHKASGLWKSSIRSGSKKIDLGLFGTEREAHAAYVQAKRLLHDGNTL